MAWGGVGFPSAGTAAVGDGCRADEDGAGAVEEDRPGRAHELLGRGQQERADVGVAGAGGRIEVEPEVLLRSGQRMGSIGTQLGMLSDALGAALGSGIASGMDPAGANFGMSYGRQ